jgi:hypothetical protein
VYRGRGDAQSSHDVRDGHPGHDPQQDDLSVRAGQRGDQRGEPSTVPGLDSPLAGPPGIRGSYGRELDGREDRRWRHRYAIKGAAAGIGRCARSPNLRCGFGVPAVGSGWVVAHRSVRSPTHQCQPRRARPSGPVWCHRGDTGARRDRSRSRRSGKAHGYPPTTGLGAGRRALVPPGSGACATDSSRVHRFRKPLWLIKVRLGTKEPRRTGESYPRFDGEW